MKLFSICGALGACSVLALVTGCGGAQMQAGPPGSISQNAARSASKRACASGFHSRCGYWMPGNA